MLTKSFFQRLGDILLAGWLLGLGTIGCEHRVAPTQVEPIQPTLSSIQAHVFTRSCALPSCHSSASQRGGLILEAGKSYANLVQARSLNSAARAQNKFRVAPFQPDSSFLLIKLIAPSSGEGSVMPEGNNRLPEAGLRAIREWIKQGAQDN